MPSTPLDKIENNDIPDSQASDEERVQRIIQEMNTGGAEDHHQESPGRDSQEQAHHYQKQHEQPHPSMLQQQHQPMGPNGQMQPQMYYPPQRVPVQREQHNEPAEQVQTPEPVVVKKNIWAHITDTLKLPFVVTFVFFLLSLPIIDVYLSKYTPWAFSSGGQLSYGGLALKAVTAGAVMGVYDTLDKFVSRFF